MLCLPVTPHKFPVADVMEVEEVGLAGTGLEEVILCLKNKGLWDIGQYDVMLKPMQWRKSVKMQ